MEKHHVYKVYRNDVFLGTIQNVRNPFKFSWDINSLGCQITVEVPIKIEVSDEPVGAILDESGSAILDEDDNEILEERAPEVFGNSSNAILLRNGNKIVVTEYSSRYPNGKVMFNGKINRLAGKISGQNSQEIVTATVFSLGDELDHYLIQDGS